MDSTSVTSKGQVTIPKGSRQALGIRQGTRVEFVLIDGRAEMRVKSSPDRPARSGFGMLSSRRKPVPADLDVATIVKR